jgi:uncharacterized membrane protein YjgN (DUF898 family)
MTNLTEGATPPAKAPQPFKPKVPIHHLRVVFTGSGSEYFRIWLVNLLLTLVTFGIYYPWAKVRRLRYFYGNTVVGGEPLDFHADPKKMFKGYVLVGILFLLYSKAGEFSPTAGFVAFLIVMAIGPALLRSSICFRMANTSWRGLRFHFTGSTGGVYKAVLPLLVPSAIFSGALIWVDNPETPPMWYFYSLAAVTAGAMLLGPWLLWNLKQYQHNHYGLASLQTSFKASLGSFYLLALKTVGVALVAIGLSVGLLMGSVYLVSGTVGLGPMKGAGAAAAAFGAAMGVFVGLIAVFVVIKPYVVSRLQNLVWTRTGNSSLRFISALEFKSLLWLTIKNWLLIVLTLGFYWPFAAVALARLRLEAVGVRTRMDPDDLVAQLQQQPVEAAGDAAGDFFGIDIGL